MLNRVDKKKEKQFQIMKRKKIDSDDKAMFEQTQNKQIRHLRPSTNLTT